METLIMSSALRVIPESVSEDSISGPVRSTALQERALSSLMQAAGLPLRERIRLAADALRTADRTTRQLTLFWCVQDKKMMDWAHRHRKGVMPFVFASSAIAVGGIAMSEGVLEWWSYGLPLGWSLILSLAAFSGVCIRAECLTPQAKLAYSLVDIEDHPLALLGELSVEWNRTEMPDGLKALLDFSRKTSGNDMTRFLVRIEREFGWDDQQTLLRLVESLRKIRDERRGVSVKAVVLDGEDEELLARLADLFVENEVVHVPRASPQGR